MKPYLTWVLVNYILPLVPFALKGFVYFFGPNGSLSLNGLIDTDDLLIYSFIVCVINLNINLHGDKNLFENLLRIFLYVLIVLDNVILALIYTKQGISHINMYLFFAIGYPILMGPIYKFKYQKQIFE